MKTVERGVTGRASCHFELCRCDRVVVLVEEYHHHRMKCRVGCEQQHKTHEAKSRRQTKSFDPFHFGSRSKEDTAELVTKGSDLPYLFFLLLCCSFQRRRSDRPSATVPTANTLGVSSESAQKMITHPICLLLVGPLAFQLTGASWVDPDTPEYFTSIKPMHKGDRREYELVRTILHSLLTCVLFSLTHSPPRSFLSFRYSPTNLNKMVEPSMMETTLGGRLSTRTTVRHLASTNSCSFLWNVSYRYYVYYSKVRWILTIIFCSPPFLLLRRVDTNAALHYYSHDNAHTKNGVLNISTIQKVNNYRAFNEKTKTFYADKKYVQSAMMQSWNKFCFTGGIVEFSAKLPGKPDVGGLWPARKFLVERRTE